MANDTETFPQRVARYDDGTELGPRVLKAGIIDGTGEFAGPTKIRADTAEKAIELVDWHADHGYVQIKIYSSIKPELVPIMADRAHARGMRVSGHVPAFMSARQFVENGADEIQHFNFIELNFLFPEVKETRNRDRFIKVVEHAREFTPDKPAVREFIKFLKDHHTVLDPTMNLFEGLFCGDPSAVTSGLEEIVPRFPAQIRRSMRSGALEAPADKAAAYREAFAAMLRLLKAVSDAGITIIPGTDALPGYSLHHELELYVRAGIPASEVLRLATLTPSQVISPRHCTSPGGTIAGRGFERGLRQIRIAYGGGSAAPPGDVCLGAHAPRVLVLAPSPKRTSIFIDAESRCKREAPRSTWLTIAVERGTQGANLKSRLGYPS
jgi:hypothetical protein